MTGSAPAEPGSVKSARRVLDILELLAVNRDGMTFLQIADELSLAKSSLHGLLATMLDRHWIFFDPASRQYRTGVRAWEAGQGYRRAADLAVAADRHLHAAGSELGETVQLAILDGVEVVYVAKVESDQPLHLASRVGARLPAYATGLGKVLLAALPAAELQQRLEGTAIQHFTERTVRDVAELEQRLAATRADGVGIDDGEHTEGVFCVAVAVHDESGTVVAAMSCSVPQARVKDRAKELRRLSEVLRRHADDLSVSLGWHVGPHLMSSIAGS
jgi:IclR family transcriptional regulator, KDG regulon repressor